MTSSRTQRSLLESTSYLLVALHRAHRGALAPRLADLGLNPGAELALAEVWREQGITHSQLAARLGVTRAAVTKLVRTLERAGYVERLGDPEDGRVSRLHVTALGRSVQRALQPAWREAEREALAGLSASEVLALHDLLARAVRHRRTPIG